MAYQTPVLLLIFNRLETTQQVFQQIKKVEPKQLFIVGDGPRPGRSGEKEKCDIVRKWVVNAVDWDCELKTLFREENKGCGKGVSEGISWFFDQVEEGIILEDDILVDLSFFPFCSEMLEKYRYEENVMSITATNLMTDQLTRTGDSYFFTNYGSNWGWATWSKSWKGFDYNMDEWNSKKTHYRFIRKFGYSQYLFFKSIFDVAVNGKRDDIWDYQWWFCLLNSSGLTIMPSVNLMKNVGFGANATHTVDFENSGFDVPVAQLCFPLKHPHSITVNKEYEEMVISKFYSVNYSPWQKLKMTRKLLS
jgi:hypothetical protein